MGTRGVRPKRAEVKWSPELAYAVGLIATDGCLSSSGRHIELTSKDEEQLKNFMLCIGKDIRITSKLSSYSDSPTTRVQFSDVTLYRFLLAVGLTPRKTKTIATLNIPEPLFFDFLRGHLDGDGCFYSYFDPRWRSSFMFYLCFVSASEAHIQWPQTTIMRLCGAKGHLVYTGRAGQKIWNVRYAKKEAFEILSKLYAQPGTICLSRKRLKIQEALGIVGLSLPGC